MESPEAVSQSLSFI
ncbi:BnaA08g25750D [Brassica napus]|uniref:BnaA08g25750D protein n=1 Tax=Brassica napus TaxID=3708 RepID=A0A078G376_BRANA|nr:BnaA08g25750D [Brassica napus]